MRHRLVLLLALAGIVLWADPAAADRRIRPVDPSAPVRLALPGPGPYATYSAAALSPDGRRFAAAWQKDKVGVWDLAKNRLVVELSADDVVALQFSPGGDRLAVARLDRPTPQAPLVECRPDVCLWDVAGGRESARLMAQGQAVLRLAFSADGKTLITGGLDGRIGLWDARTGEERRTIDAHRGAVLGLTLSADGKALLTAGADAALREWEFPALTAGATLKAPAGLTCVDLSPDGGQVAAGDAGGNVHFWGRPSGKLLRTLAAKDKYVSSVAFAPDGSLLLTSGPTGARLWETADGAERGTLEAKAATVFGHFLPDGKSALIVPNGSKPQLWPVAGKAGPQLLFAPGETQFALLSPDRKTLYAVGDRAFSRWDAVSGDLLSHHPWKPLGGKELILGAALAEDGKSLALFGGNGVYRLVDPGSGATLEEITNPEDLGARLSKPTDESRLLRRAAGQVMAPDGESRWAVKDQKLTRTTFDLKLLQELDTSNYGHTVQGRMFVMDGKQLLTRSKDGTVRLWDMATRAETLRLEVKAGSILAVGLTADQKFVLTLADPNQPVQADVARPPARPKALPRRLELWEVTTRRPRWSVDLPTGAVVQEGLLDGSGPDRVVIFLNPSPPEEAAVVRVIDATANKVLHDWKVPGRISSAAASADGKLVHLLQRTKEGDVVVSVREVAGGEETARFVRDKRTPGLNDAGFFYHCASGRLACVETAAEGPVLTLWDTATGKACWRRPWPPKAQLKGISPDGALLAYAVDNDGETYLCDTATGGLLRRLPDYFNGFTPDGKGVHTGMFIPGNRSRLHLWATTTGKQLGSVVFATFFPGHEEGASHFALSPDGKKLATGTLSHFEVRLWDVATGKQTELVELRASPWAVGFSRDGHLLVGTGRALQVRDRETYAVQRSYAMPPLSRRFGFSDDGKALFAVAYNGGVWLWNLTDR